MACFFPPCASNQGARNCCCRHAKVFNQITCTLRTQKFNFIILSRNVVNTNTSRAMTFCHLTYIHQVQKKWHPTLRIRTDKKWERTNIPSEQEIEMEKKWKKKSNENKTHRLWRRLFLTRFFCELIQRRKMWLHTIWLWTFNGDSSSNNNNKKKMIKMKETHKKREKARRIKMSLFKCNEIMLEHRISINIIDLKMGARFRIFNIFRLQCNSAHRRRIGVSQMKYVRIRGRFKVCGCDSVCACVCV